MSTALKAIHDNLLAGQPEGASHDVTDCPFCTPGVAEVASASTDSEGSVSDKTYTQEEHDALASQVASLEATVAEMTKAAGASEIEARIADVEAKAKADVADAQGKLDTAVLEAQAAKDELANVNAFLAAEVASATEAAEIEARRETRIAAVKEFASFPDAYLDEHADRFVAMSDEDFAAALDDWKAIAPAKAAGDETIPNVTAMTASRSTTDSGSKSALSEVMNLRFAGVDTRTV